MWCAALEATHGGSTAWQITTLALLAMCSDAHAVTAAIMLVDAGWGLP
jgi:hypothetical protein